MTTLATATAGELFELLREDLRAIEVMFTQQAVSGVAAITDIGNHLREGGGKRLRPSLLLLAAKALGYHGAATTSLGAVIEMVHTATLVHDDIIDDARTRRGRPSANTTWGNSKCVLAGDWLYMQAFRLSLEERNFHILDLLIGLTKQMVEGELLQMEKLGQLITIEEHLDLIYRKTACLFSVCMRLGAILGGATAEQEEALGKYGHDLGMAFQLVDDVLDLTASADVLGKPVASDLREGKVTMAVIHALERCTTQERAKIETILRDRAFNGVTHAQIMEVLQHYGSLEAATARAARYAESARTAICTFPDSEIKRALLWAPEFVVAREK